MRDIRDRLFPCLYANPSFKTWSFSAPLARVWPASGRFGGVSGAPGRGRPFSLLRWASSWGLASGAVVSLRSWTFQHKGFAQGWPFGQVSRLWSGWGGWGWLQRRLAASAWTVGVVTYFSPSCLAVLLPVSRATLFRKMTSRLSPWWGVVGWGGDEMGDFRRLRAASCQAFEVFSIFSATFCSPRTHTYHFVGPASKSCAESAAANVLPDLACVGLLRSLAALVCSSLRSSRQKKKRGGRAGKRRSSQRRRRCHHGRTSLLPQRGTEATAQVRHGCGLQDEKAPKLGGSREPRGQRKKCGVREPRVLAHCLHRCQVLRAVPMRQVQRQ